MSVEAGKQQACSYTLSSLANTPSLLWKIPRHSWHAEMQQAGAMDEGDHTRCACSILSCENTLQADLLNVACTISAVGMTVHIISSEDADCCMN